MRLIVSRVNSFLKKKMIGHTRVSFAIVDFMLTFRTMCEKQNK